MKVKICGIRNKQDLDVAVNAGADALGFLVGLTHFSEDVLAPREALKLIETVPPFVTPVLVTHYTLAKKVISLSRYLGVQTIQLHSDISLNELAKIRETLKRHILIKAIHVEDGVSVDSLKTQLTDYIVLVNAFVMDSRTKERLGGTGETHDWNKSAELVKFSRKPIILAGGLNPTNVRAAIAQVQPYAVDVNSGVEKIDGNKDFDLCNAFVEQARSGS
jgi:phosphoribosylanthranilate isomerase